MAEAHEILLEESRSDLFSKRVRRFLRDLVVLLFSFPFSLFYACYMATIRVTHVAVPEVGDRWVKGGAVIFPHYHRDIPLLVGKHAFRRVSTMASLSKDGDFITRILELLGYKVARGSSSKGGAQGLHQLAHFVRSGCHAAIAVDGPRGPRGIVKIGAILLSKETGIPIAPSGCAVNRAWQLHSWDQMVIPKPFSKAVIFFGEPLLIPKDASDEALNNCRRGLKQKMIEAAQRAQSLLSGLD